MYRDEGGEENDMELESRLSRLQNLVQGIRSELQFEKSLLQREKQACSGFCGCAHDRGLITCSDRSLGTPAFKSNFSLNCAPTTSSAFSEPSSNFPKMMRAERWCLADEAARDELGLDLADFYKRKISDLEADCCAGLNKIRSRFTTQSTSLASQTSSEERSSCDDSGVLQIPRALGFGDVPLDHRRRGFDNKSVNDGVETLWSAVGDPFSEADFTALMNETSCANECLISSEAYPELTLPPESARSNFAY